MENDLKYLNQWLEIYFSFVQNIKQSEASLRVLQEMNKIRKTTFEKGDLRGMEYIKKDMMEMVKYMKIDDILELAVLLYSATGQKDERLDKLIEKYFKEKKVIKSTTHVNLLAKLGMGEDEN